MKNTFSVSKTVFLSETRILTTDLLTKRESYRASQEAKKQANQEATQEDTQQSPSQQDERMELKRKRGRDSAQADQAMQLPNKRRRPAAYANPSEPHRKQVSAAVQTNTDIEEEAETPSQQQDPDFPRTPAPDGLSDKDSVWEWKRW